jgi:predicted nucleic acid-binding Zn ribbon protein
MNCEKCGSPFVALNNNGSVAKKRFCSEKCRKAAERKRSAWTARNKGKTRSASKMGELFKPVDGMCGVCGEHPVEGRQKYCSKECYKWAKRCWDAGYEIMLPQYEALKKEAGGRCQSCGELEGDNPLQIDHCHSTGAVRGLICGCCNSAAAQAKDSPERLRALADYLDSCA